MVEKWKIFYIPSARVRRSDIVLWTGGITTRIAGRRHLSSGRGLIVLRPDAPQPSKKFRKRLKNSAEEPLSYGPGCCVLTAKERRSGGVTNFHFLAADRTTLRRLMDPAASRFRSGVTLIDALAVAAVDADLPWSEVRRTSLLHGMDRTTCTHSGRGGLDTLTVMSPRLEVKYSMYASFFTRHYTKQKSEL